MRKCLLIIGWLGLAFSSMSALAQGASAMVMNVAGQVLVEAIGSAARPLEPFSRLLEEDRVKLGRDGKLILVYGRTGRQETWTGPGVIVAGSSQSAIVSGEPALEVKQLPAKVAQVMARTPVADNQGKAGMVRVRSIATPEALAALERNYRDLRSASDASDRNPEVYWLAGLFEMGAHDRLKEELVQIESSYPEDPSIKVLAKLYARAMNNARQARR